MTLEDRVVKPVCPVCLETAASTERPVFDDRYGYPGSFSLVRCRSCGHLMTTPQLREAELPSLYGRYYPRKSITAESVAKQAVSIGGWLSRWLRWLAGTDNQGQYQVRAGERMLDIGCGSGLSLLEAQLLGAHAWGIEADPNVQPIASKLGLRVHQGNLQDAPFPETSFDLVVLNQVIEHIPQPHVTLETILARLAPSGRVVLVFPNVKSFWCKVAGSSWINWHVPYHLHHFSCETFSQMAKRCGYRVVRTKTVTPNLWTVLQIRTIGKTSEIGKPSALWAVTASKNEESSEAQHVINGNMIRQLKRVLLFVAIFPIAVFNRLLDFIGWGDSLVVEIVPTER
jgi:SAM-dependent methyltransferase